MVRVPLVVRENLQGGTRRGLLSVFLHKKYIHSCSFCLSGSVNKFLNFCVAYFPCCFLEMAIKISHSHFVHVAFVSILVSRLLIEWYLAHWLFLEQGGTWWQYGSHKWCVIRKRLRTTALNPIENLLELSTVHYSRVSYFFRLVRIECN